MVTDGDIPSPRTIHSNSCQWGQTLVVFGGGETGTTPVTDNKVHLFQPSEFYIVLLFFLLNIIFNLLLLLSMGSQFSQ